MSRTQDTILIDGVPTRPLQETVPQSKSAAGLAGPPQRVARRRRVICLSRPPPGTRGGRPLSGSRRAGGEPTIRFARRPLVVPPIWSRSICPDRARSLGSFSMSPARFAAAVLLVPALCLRVGVPRPAGSSRTASGPAMIVAEPLATSLVSPFGPPDASRLKVMIAGGGIGGLCTALVLQKQGHDVHIYEKATSYRPFGGPIQIASNALESLKRIDEDVYNAILEKATSIGTRKNGLKDGVSNEWFATFDLYAPARRRGQDSSVVIDRPILQEILLAVPQRAETHKKARPRRAAPEYVSCASSTRPWRLWAAHHSRGGGAAPPGATPLPQGFSS